MVKLIFLTIITILIVYQNQVHARSTNETQVKREKRFITPGTVLLIVNAGSALISIGEFIESFINYDEFQKSSWLEVDRSLMEFEKNFRHNFHLVMKNILELPNFLAFLLEQRNFRTHLFRTHEIFRSTCRMSKKVDENFLSKDLEAKRKFIEDFVHVNDASLEESILEIHRIFIDTDTTGFTTDNINVNLKKFLTVCRTKMSELQVLEYLLTLVRVAYGEYYQTKIQLLELLKQYTPIDIDSHKKVLKNNIDSDYELIVIEFKKMINTASQELYACDARDYKDDTRYKNYSDYSELQMFSTYILDTHDHTEPICENNRIPETCYDTTMRSLCHETRRCQGELSQCRSISPSTTPHVCVNEDKNAMSRYYEIKLDGSTDDGFTCKAGNIMDLIPYNDNEKRYCNCLCLEQRYYVDKSRVLSDINNQKVVTGARLVVDKQILRIEIQQAKISVNGTIVSAADWKERKIDSVIGLPDNMLKLEAVDLSEIQSIPSDEVIVGFQFEEIRSLSRIRLIVLTSKFNAETGILSTNIMTNIPARSSEKFNLEDQDVPTKGPNRNEPISKSNQYVTFTTTSKLKDGGQTTIPFIDTQKVETGLRPVPLSGAGIYIRGQPGYGGFLALRLYTYNRLSFLATNDYYTDSISIDNPFLQT